MRENKKRQVWFYWQWQKEGANHEEVKKKREQVNEGSLEAKKCVCVSMPGLCTRLLVRKRTGMCSSPV